MIDLKYINSNFPDVFPSYGSQMLDYALRNRNSVDQATVKIFDFLKNNELFTAICDFHLLMRSKVFYVNQIESIQSLGNQIKNMTRDLVKSWNNRINDPKVKKTTYQEIFRYCRFIAKDELSPASSFKAFPCSETKSKFLVEIKKNCAKRSLEVLTKILKGNCLLHMGRKYEAFNKLEGVRHDFPNLFLLNLTIGKVFLSTGRGEQAVKVFDALLNHYSDKIEIYIGLAMAHETAGHALLAYDWSHKAFQYDPTNIKVQKLYQKHIQQYGFLY